MDKKRREFLKIAGISTLAGLGAPAVVDGLISGSFPAVARAAKEVTGNGHGEGNNQAAPADHGTETAKTGKRYGMIIDVRKFFANPDMAEECTKQCHKVHNVPNFPDQKDEIKWIWLTGYENAFPGHSQYYRNEEIEKNDILVLCNHCDNPPCVRACPTKATFKNQDGIVAMDYHRCIGCRFCMMGCPYGARSFNWMEPRPYIKEYNPDFPTRMRGVVEKCNFCGERLAIGQEPACLEAVKEVGAIVFGDLNDPKSEIRQLLDMEATIQRKPSLGTKPSVFYIV